MSGGPTDVQMDTAVQVAARLLTSESAGLYRHLVMDAPQVAATARPGQFVALGVGGQTSGLLLRRAFSIHRVDAAAGTVDIVVSAHGPGTQWLVEQPAGTSLDVVGPLGRPFRLPPAAAAAVVIGGGYGSAPLRWWADELTARGHRVDAILGAGDAGRLFDVEPMAGAVTRLEVTTDDGSAGARGRVTDPLPDVIAAAGSAVVYACGPMAMLRAVTEVARASGARAQVAVEEAMACGVGICMTCVLPVVGEDGTTRMVRSCLEGPVFDGDRVRWDAWTGHGSAVPHDALGAPVVAPAPQAPASPGETP